MESQFRILGPIEVDLKAAGALHCRADGCSPSWRSSSCTGERSSASTGSWTSCGREPARGTQRTRSKSSPRGCALPWARTSWSRRRGGYALRLPPGALDADRFEERFQRGREELTGRKQQEAAETLREALALWRGPALADVRDEGFAQPEIARLDDLRLACLEDRVDADLACARHAEVAGELEALVRQHPLRERLRGQLMLALYHSGRQADALAAYRSAHRALVDGLGIEPSPELRALEAAILRQDVPAPALALRPSAARASVGPDVRRRVTCLCSQLARPDEPADLDPESLRAVLEGYHATARAVCARHGGTMAELRGDAVLAVFGMPVTHEDDAQRALRAAAELGSRTEHLPFGFRGRSGVCTGDVVASAQGRGAAPVIGEAVAAAEELARSAAGGEIRIDESTWQLVSPRRPCLRASRRRASAGETSRTMRRQSGAGSIARSSAATRSSAACVTPSRVSWPRARRRS